MGFSPVGSIGPSPEPTMHVKGKPPLRGSKPPKNPIGPELGTVPVSQRAKEQRGHSGAKQEKARIGVDFNTATSLWGGYKKTTESMIKAQGTPDYDQLSAAREAHLEELKTKVSPRIAEFGKAWGTAAINGASGNRQMAKYAEQMDIMAGEFIARGAQFAASQRVKSNPEPSAREHQELQTKQLHKNQAAQKRTAETLARKANIQKRQQSGS